MLADKERTEIKLLMQQEIIPAVGCTEPIAVSLCTARATEVLGEIPDKIDVHLSANIIKNAMGVGIPGTGMNGLPIAIALGALIGKSEKGLELLDNISHEDVERGKKFINDKIININLKDNISEKLYIEVHCVNKENRSVATITGNHTFFSHIELNGKTLYKNDTDSKENLKNRPQLSFRKIYLYATESPIDELEFILDAARMNKRAAERSYNGQFGHNVSKNIKGETGQRIFGDNLHSRMVSSTAGACDVRMAGAMVPVMSNSGSGNQGIAATLPVLTFAENTGASDEQLIRALILSNLSMIYIKQHIGRLSALCGCVVASTGSSCGITYLMGGNYNQITFAAKNMIANITGMICDGAKPSCALKIASGVSTATLSALMAIEDGVASPLEGIIDQDIDQTIRNLALIGNNGMSETDKVVLDIIINK
ncbi:L-cysteine desulfidase family protein [Lascolabacillus massiliensis]|uniref:L-cysteine desulfidase family protein n=1 Tax=Lascolabacillus massiliensis TaxID=1627894 RepID=UPI0006B39733|nr:L-serine ammonia-lyase, iron-sulfur-dependent, subunit alpha [Lascolabacillus massiliensis]